MTDSLITNLISLMGIAAGGAIGILFGKIQNAAMRRNRQMQESGALRTGWLVMPGSMGRVALLLFVLVIVQIGCPLLFQGSIKWLVSAGLVSGYGWTLMERIRHQGS